jgi:hypothetical protein
MFLGVKVRPNRKADNLTTTCELTEKSGIIDVSQQSQLVRAIALTLFCTFVFCGEITGPDINKRELMI